MWRSSPRTRRILARLRLPEPWSSWLTTAIIEEEGELAEAIRPQMGNRP